jgi:hypothetical protein
VKERAALDVRGPEELADELPALRLVSTSSSLKV